MSTSVELKFANVPPDQDVTAPSNPGLVRRFDASFCRQVAHVAPWQPYRHVVGFGATQAPAPLHVEGPRAPTLVQDAAAQVVDAAG